MRALLLIAIGAMAGCTDARLEQCENKVRSTLKAPSTYKLIKSTGSTTGGETVYSIEYDAANAYGTPLRGRGVCAIGKDGVATWIEPKSQHYSDD